MKDLLSNAARALAYYALLVPLWKYCFQKLGDFVKAKVEAGRKIYEG